MTASNALAPTTPHPPGQRHLPAAVACLFLLVAATAAAVFKHGVLPGAESRPWEPWAVLLLVGLPGLLLAALLRRQARERALSMAQADRLTAKLDELALVARLMSNSVAITDAAGRITWVNASFERETGYSAAEAVGHSPGQLLQCPQTDPATVALIDEAMNAGRPCAGEILNRNKDGRLYWLAFDIQPMHDSQGRLFGFTIVKTDLTERKRNEAALRASQVFLRNTGRIAGVGGWQFRLHSGEIEWNEQARNVLGLAPEAQPTLLECLEWCTPEARVRIAQAVAHGMLPDRTWDMDLAIVTPAGQAMWLRVMAKCEDDDQGSVRLTGALMDISARIAMQAEVERSAELLHGAIDTVDEAFVIYDPNDRLVLCNDKYRDLFKNSRELIVPGVRLEDLLRNGAQNGQFPDAVGRVEDWVAECMHKHHHGNEARIQRVSDGRVLRIIDRRMPDGHTVGFRIDLTDLARATEAAQRANGAKSEFIATISHELRTPLQSIMGFSELGQQFAQDERHSQFEAMFGDIHAGGQRMLTLVNGLLDLSALDAGSLHLNRRRCDLLALARDVIGELQPLAAQNRHHIDISAGTPALPAQADSFRLQQVIRNLLANALRFAPAGSPIELAGSLDADGSVQFTVRDHGPGIPPDEMESIFESFVQSSATRDGSGGSGLGLAISRKIMQAHDGSLLAENAPGGGALLRLRLPGSIEVTPSTTGPST